MDHGSENVPEEYTLFNPNFDFEVSNYGYSDISLTLLSEHGCSDTKDSTDVVLLNGYGIDLVQTPSLLCFNGAETVDATLFASINPTYPIDFDDFDITANWDINPLEGSLNLTESDNIDSVSYRFNLPNTYSYYSISIDDVDCVHSQPIQLDIGVNSKIKDFIVAKYVLVEITLYSMIDSFDTGQTLSDDLIISDSTSAQTNLA